MLVAIIAAAFNEREVVWRLNWSGKIKALGCEVVYWEADDLTPPPADVLVVLLDGHGLTDFDHLRLGVFRQLADTDDRWPKRLIVAYEYAKSAAEPYRNARLFDHIAVTERNFIYCLKDYLFFSNQHGVK